MVGHLRTSKVTPGDFDTLRRQELLREARAEDGKIEPFPKKGGEQTAREAWNRPPGICPPGIYALVDFSLMFFLEYTTWKVDGGATP